MKLNKNNWYELKISLKGHEIESIKYALAFYGHTLVHLDKSDIKDSDITQIVRDVDNVNIIFYEIDKHLKLKKKVK
jgi:hypothetical protein